MSYIVNLSKELININFNILPVGCSSQNISDDCKFMSFVKKQGHITYGVSVINCDIESDYINCANILEKSFEKIYGNKIFLVLLVTSKADDKILEYSHNDIDDYTKELINIKWVVDIENKEIVVKGEQPDELLDIRTAIMAAFESDKDLNITTQELRKKTQDIQVANIKCKNSYATYMLFVINTIFWVIMYTGWGSDIVSDMALDKELTGQGQIYRLFTYMFTHGGFIHYMCNNFSLMIIGTRVEKYTGHTKFLAVYFLSGIIAGCTSILVNPYGVAVGASGAIFGIVGLLIYLAYSLKHLIGGFDLYMAVIYALVGVASGFMFDNVDNFAHIGGLVGGIIVSAVIKAEK